MNKAIRLTRNKTFEFQIETRKEFTYPPFEFCLWWSTKADHAGLFFNVQIYRLFWLMISIYDNRHWDDEHNCWDPFSDEGQFK